VTRWKNKTTDVYGIRDRISNSEVQYKRRK